MMCFGIHGIWSNSFDQLPVVLQKEGICRHLSSRQQKCNANENLSWEMHYNRSYADVKEYKSHDTIIEDQDEDLYDSINCRLKCLQDSKCILIVNKNSPGICYVNDNYQTNKQEITYQNELAILSCCKKVPQMYKTKKIIDETLAGELYKHIKTKNQPKCMKTAYVKYKNKDSQFTDIKYYNSVTVEDCMKFCNEHVSCVLFNFWNGLCYLKYLLREIKYAKDIDLYVLSCLQNDTDQLPPRPPPQIIWQKYGTCRHLTTKQEKCDEDEDLVWEIFYETTYIFFTKQEAYDNIECRLKCLQDPKCILVTNSFSKHCLMNDDYQPKYRMNNSHFELAVLSCCKPVPQKYYTTKIVDETVFEKYRQHIDKDSQGICAEPVYVKYKEKDCLSGDIIQFTNVTVEDCMKFCNEQFNCVLFNFCNGECKLKHIMREISNSEIGVDLYVLSCLPNQLPVVWQKDGVCRHLTSKQEKCNEDENLSWEIQYETTYSDHVTFEYLQNIECRLKCFQDPNCILVTNKYSAYCYLNDIYQPNRQYGSSQYELSILSCCKKVSQKYNTTRIINESFSKGFWRPIVKKSQRFCMGPVYVKYNSKNSLSADIMYLPNVTLEDCMQFCNEHFSCLLFNFRNDECKLKHLLREVVTSEGLDLYVLSCMPNQLPVVEQDDNICRHLTSKQEECNANEDLSWEVQYGTTYSDYLSFEYLHGLECRLKCFQDPKCILVTNKYSAYCYLNNVYQSSRQYGSSQYELSILSCCKKVPQEINTIKVIDKTVSGELCRHIEKKRHTRCEKAVYVKHKDKDSFFADIMKYQYVTVEDCMKFCNEHLSCVLFNFLNGMCTLKHLLREIWDSEGVDLYVLSCFPKTSSLCASCPAITNRNTACESSKSIVWNEVSQFKLIGGYKETPTLTFEDCLDLCVESPACIAISYQTDLNKACMLLDSVGESEAHTESEYGILKCEQNE